MFWISNVCNIFTFLLKLENALISWLCIHSTSSTFSLELISVQFIFNFLQIFQLLFHYFLIQGFRSCPIFSFRLKLLSLVPFDSIYIPISYISSVRATYCFMLLLSLQSISMLYRQFTNSSLFLLATTDIFQFSYKAINDV